MSFCMISESVMLSWSYGEVFNVVSFDQKTNSPIANGLFCPSMFGPLSSYECLCVKPLLSNLLYCEMCGVDFNLDNILLRSSFGHMQLAVPVVHVWFYKSVLNIISMLLDKPLSIVNDMMNCNLHIMVETVSSEFKIGQFMNSEMYETLWASGSLHKVLSGGMAILELLSKVCLDSLKFSLLNSRKFIKSVSVLNKLNNKINIMDGLMNNNIEPFDFIISVLPVLPAVFRRALTMNDNDVGTPVFSGLNKLYERVMSINNSMLLFNFNASVLNFSEYMNNLSDLQCAVDMLIDNSSGNKGPMCYNTMALKSLSGMLKGKTGSFSNTLLGKSVDYSGRSVIVPGPELLLCECAIPRVMALELFKPFIYFKTMLKYGNNKISFVKSMLFNNPSLENEFLEEVIKYCPVVLNSAPTLHKLSMSAFWVKLTNEKAMRLHPLTCSGFNADFDGDQMAVHVPLSFEASMEAVTLMLSVSNVLHPAHGSPCILPTQDMMMGLYYMSLTSLECKDMCFTSYVEIDSALLFGMVNLHTKVKFIISKNDSFVTMTSTPGRLLIMGAVPSKCNFMYEWSKPDFSSSYIYDIIELVLLICGRYEMVSFCETLMTLGLKYVSQSGISLSSLDLVQSKYKTLLISEVRLIVIDFLAKFSWDNMKLQSDMWSSILDNMYNVINLDVSCCSINQTSVQIMLNSGARGTLSQVKQLMGSSGYIIGFNNKFCKVPMLNSYLDGLNLVQFFCCTYSSSSSLMDTVLKTPASGYLTSKLVEMSRECMMNEEDCNVETGLCVKMVWNLDFIKNSLMGRFLAKPVVYNNKIVMQSNVLVTEGNMCNMLSYCNGYVYISSPLMCRSKGGVCKLCYGIDLNSAVFVSLGSSIGVLAAQAISEPGVQLTLSTFHGLNGIGYDGYSDSGLKNVLQAPCSGIMVLTNLSCVCTFSGDMVMVNTCGVLSILDNNVVIWSRSLYSGGYLLVSNNVYVNVDTVLCFNYLSSNSCLSLVWGVLFLSDWMYNLGLQSILSDQMSFMSYSVNKYYSCKSSMFLMCFKVGFVILYCLVDKNNNLLALVGTKVNVFDMLLTLQKSSYDVVRFSNFGGFSKLSKLFEGKIEVNCLVISCVGGTLSYGNLNNNLSVYIVDPAFVLLKPMVYFIYNGGCLLEDNEKLDYGRPMVSGEVGFLSCTNTHEFNSFLDYFINMFLEIYEFQGVNMNSKHIEVVLSQMISFMSVFDKGDTSFTCDSKYKFQDISLVNYYINSMNGKLVLFSSEMMGVTSLCTYQISMLSSISFYGSMSLMIKAMLIDGLCVSKGMKDNIILGNLPSMGTGFMKSLVNNF